MRAPTSEVVAHDSTTLLDLVLVQCGDGYSYSWEDGHGRPWITGWHRGNKQQAREYAEWRLTVGARRVA